MLLVRRVEERFLKVHEAVRPADILRWAASSPVYKGRLRNSTSPPSVEIDPPTISAVIFLQMKAGRSNGSKLSSVILGVVLSLLGQKFARQ